MSNRRINKLFEDAKVYKAVYSNAYNMASFGISYIYFLYTYIFHTAYIGQVRFFVGYIKIESIESKTIEMYRLTKYRLYIE